MVQAVTLPEGKVKIAAKNFDFDADANNWNLTGGCAINVVQDEKHSLRFKGDTAKVEAAAEDIEWQITSSDPVDVGNVPVRALANVLTKIPKESPIRLMWYWAAGSSWQDNTALYDRMNHSLKEKNLFFDELSSGVRRNIYINVTDEAIEKMAKTNVYPAPFSFDSLVNYGATREERR